MTEALRVSEQKEGEPEFQQVALSASASHPVWPGLACLIIDY